MHREHRLVRGDHRLAGSQCRLHQGARRPIRSADQLHHHVHGGVGGKCDGILVPAQAGQRHAAIARAVASGHRGDGDRPSGARGDDVGVVAQQLQHAAADGAQAGDRDGEGVGHRSGAWSGGAALMGIVTASY